MDIETALTIKALITRLDKLEKENASLKHDMDIVFTCNEEQGKHIKELSKNFEFMRENHNDFVLMQAKETVSLIGKAETLKELYANMQKSIDNILKISNTLTDRTDDHEERLAATEDTVQDIVEDLTSCDCCDGGCEVYSCKNEEPILDPKKTAKLFEGINDICNSILKKKEEPKAEAPKEEPKKKPDITTTFYEFIERYSTERMFLKKAHTDTLIKLLRPIAAQLVTTCNKYREPFKVFEKIVDACILYEVEDTVEVIKICDAINDMGSSPSQKGNWLVGFIGQDLAITKLC